MCFPPEFSKNFRRHAFLVLLLFVSLCSARAVDFSEGRLLVLPVAEGKAPVIDGDASDWNLVAQEPAYLDGATVKDMHTQWAFMADDEALYVLVESSLPAGRAYNNANDPHERFWRGDVLQLRMTSDPVLQHPLNRQRDAESERVFHISMWKNSETEEEFIHLARGTMFDLGSDVNPPGSAIKVVEKDGGYVLEARIPWDALGTPDGKNPFGPDRPGIGVAETIWWPGSDATRTKLGFASDAGVFSFNRPQTWGIMDYVAEAPAERLRPPIETVVAEAAALAGVQDAGVEQGVEIVVDVPEDGLSAAVNIFGPDGGVIRELYVGEDLPKGPLTVRWDGLDAFGEPVELGTYRWGAYLHRGLKEEYMGSVGISGSPPEPAVSGLGMWGGDHSNPIAVAADESGVYFLWPVAETGRAVVKVDYEGNTVFRGTPFTGGGFGPFYAITSDGESVYVVRGREQVFLNRLDPERGRVQMWEEADLTELPLFESEMTAVPIDAVPYGVLPTTSGKRPNMLPPVEEGWVYSPNCFGIAVIGDEIFVSNFSKDAILVFDKTSGKKVRELTCVGPRGLAASDGDLLVASYTAGENGRILRFEGGRGAGKVVVHEGLNAPFAVVEDQAGNLYVSDLGKSQQLKVFSPDGKLVRSVGREGGRPWQGAYDSKSLDFLMPVGLAIDKNDTLLIGESSPPKVFSRLSLPELELTDRWYGAPTYWTSTFPMPDDPRNIFYMLTSAVGRATLAGPGEVGVPNAYWQPDRAGFPDTEDIEAFIPFPQVFRADNNRLYLAKDSGDRDVYVFEENETLRPVAQFRFIRKEDEGNERKKDYLRIWVDQNADGLQQPNEITEIEEMPDGSPLPRISNSSKSMSMFANGDVYINTSGNSILRIPAKGFGREGQIAWDLDAFGTVISPVYPGLDRHARHHRAGVLGLGRDSKGNYYVPFNARLSGEGGEFDFADEASATAGLSGMGHTATANAVKFLKFNPKGELVWMAGRKATAGAAPGEIYHFWNLAGMVGDDYVAGGSEWGTVAFYTHDGFYVDTIFNNPGLAPPVGPSTFGGETSGANVTYFPDRDEVWAYNTWRAFRVHGFENGRVAGEQRLQGQVELQEVFLPEAADVGGSQPIVIQRTEADLFAPSGDWSKVPESIVSRNDAELAQVRVAVDQEWLYGRIEVVDPTPLENEADQIELAFKWGDSAALVLGPQREQREPGLGDIRILATEIEGEPQLIAMKVVTEQARQPFEYTTPASGTVAFDFVGRIPDGRVRAEKTSDGYTVTFAVPRTFLEFDLESEVGLRGDVEIRLSGQGQRGLQATSRNYLFTPDTAATTMVDDIPVESRLYPEFWGPIEVRD